MKYEVLSIKFEGLEEWRERGNEENEGNEGNEENEGNEGNMKSMKRMKGMKAIWRQWREWREWRQYECNEENEGYLQEIKVFQGGLYVKYLLLIPRYGKHPKSKSFKIRFLKKQLLLNLSLAETRFFACVYSRIFSLKAQLLGNKSSS